MTKILITGGCGFLGSHLCKRLLDNGDEVTCLDDLSTGSLDNIKSMIGRKGFTWCQEDVRGIDFEISDYDEIYNLACAASPKAYQDDPVRTMTTNVDGAQSVLETAIHSGGKVLQASTSEIYGEPLEHPQTEEYWGNVNPIGPRSCYDEGKRAAESLFTDYHRMYGTAVRIARIFNTYGPNMAPDDGRVVSNFICQAIKLEPITIYGDGEQSRSFCYVDDLISGLIRLMASDITTPVNLGNPQEIKIIELAQKIVELVGGDSRYQITNEELPVDDPTRRCPDITKARAMGWSPEVSLEDGLARTISYFRGVL